jgi:hypothetical protein
MTTTVERFYVDSEHAVHYDGNGDLTTVQLLRGGQRDAEHAGLV